MPIIIPPHDIEEHTVRLPVEDSQCLLYGIRRKPIVGIEHTDIVTLCMFQSFVAGMSLSPILRKAHHLNTGILRGIFLQQTARVVGRSIVNTDHLDILIRLSF